MAESLPDQDAEEVAALDALVHTEVQRALGPYRGTLPEDVTTDFEDELKCFVLTHPVVWRMLARLRPRVAQAISGGEPLGAADFRREVG
jgi:hypothetical protein